MIINKTTGLTLSPLERQFPLGDHHSCHLQDLFAFFACWADHAEGVVNGREKTGS
jgi:hypothetical protein